MFNILLKSVHYQSTAHPQTPVHTQNPIMNFHHILHCVALFARLAASEILEKSQCTENKVLDGEYINGPVPMDDDPLVQFDSP